MVVLELSSTIFAAKRQTIMMGEFGDIGAMLAALKPDEPIYAFRLHEPRVAAQIFTRKFPGDVLYAVSANPHVEFLRALYVGGIRHFAVANLSELRAVKNNFPDALCYCLEPVKSVSAIREVAHDFGVTHFAADHADELAKIIIHTSPLKPTVVLRLAMPEEYKSGYVSGKFGCNPAEAAALMRAAAAEGLGVGLSFHLGSQILDPAVYRRALALAGDIVRTTGLQPELIDIGGGFPALYRNSRGSSLADYCDAVRDGIAQINLHHPAKIMCKSGRALAAAGASLMLKVELRRGNRLYLNDGIHGGLGELATHGIEPPMRAWRINGGTQLLGAALDDFSFYGPTGDNADYLKGPFALPSDIRMGDYIEIGQMGAYSINRRADFNGLHAARAVIVNDPAFLL